MDRRLDSHVPFLDTKEDWDNERNNWSGVVMDPGNDLAAWVYEIARTAQESQLLKVVVEPRVVL